MDHSVSLQFASELFNLNPFILFFQQSMFSYEKLDSLKSSRTYYCNFVQDYSLYFNKGLQNKNNRSFMFHSSISLIYPNSFYIVLCMKMLNLKAYISMNHCILLWLIDIRFYPYRFLAQILLSLRSYLFFEN